MNRKQLGILLFAAVVFGGLGLFVYQRNSASWRGSATPAGKKVLGEFDPNEAARVVIKEGGSTVTLLKQGDLWVVQERNDYPADFDRIKTLIRNLWELKPVQEMKVGPSQYARLELTLPGDGEQKDASSATTVELRRKDNEPVAGLVLGKKFLKKEGPSAEGEGYPAGRYVMPLAGAPGEKKVALVSETFEQAKAQPGEWLDKAFIRIERIKSVALSGTTPELQWKLSREKEGDPSWNLADAKPDEKVESGKAPSFSSILGAPRFVDVRSSKPETPEKAELPETPGKQGNRMIVETFDGFVYTLDLGQPEGGNLPLKVTVAADLAAKRTPGKDEKPEEQKKLDEAHAAKLKKLSEKLAGEKKFEGRTYLVSKASFDPLLKPRAELLAPKATPSPTPVPGGLPETPSPSPKSSPEPSTPAAASPTPAG